MNTVSEKCQMPKLKLQIKPKIPMPKGLQTSKAGKRKTEFGHLVFGFPLAFGF
jgi:hypothetical protein